MWSSKMAARWRRKDGLLNANSGDFPTNNNPDEMLGSRGGVADMARSTQTCVDHSILAIFEDSTVASENKRAVDEENEKLLSALTEMLDSVEDDDTLSPFDTLPESQLLVHSVCRESSVMEPLTERLRPRPKSPSLTVLVKSDGVDGEEQNAERFSHSPFKQESQAENKTVQNEVEVFTSTSLVNLVKLMHPYCLKLRVDQGDKPKKNSRFFSEGEVWRYEKPTEESDEEINVVSDDEAPRNKTEEAEQGHGNRTNGKFLKSVLVKRNSPRALSSKEKKRVSFGSVQVASFDDSQQTGLNGKTLTSGHTAETVSCPPDGSEALEVPLCSALEPHTPSSNSDKAEVVSLKAETKAKALSLQQYRQLRQKRQPLVEKQGNYVTKWPSVSEPPKELPPFPCVRGQRQNSTEPKAVLHHPQSTGTVADHPYKPGAKTSPHHTTPPPRPKPSQAKPSCHIHRSGLERPRTESRTNSPASPLLNATGNTNVVVPQCKRSLRRKATLVSSDPPNPVLLPLAVSQELTAAHTDPDSNLQSTEHLNQTESSNVCPERQAPSSQPKPLVLLPNQPQKCNLSPTNETKQQPQTPRTPSPDPVTQVKNHLSTLRPAQSSCPVDARIPARETPEVLPGVFPPPPQEPLPVLQRGCEVQNAAGESGIEAPDLTSLLEQFEETQAKEESTYETNPEPELICTEMEQQVATPVGTENTSRIALQLLGTSGALRNLPDLQTSEQDYVPEALSTEIILSTQKDQPARRKNPPSKAIQIIDPRPLPPKKIHASSLESPAKYSSSHLQLSVYSDHDYCGPVDRSLTISAQRGRAKPPSLKDTPETVSELQGRSCDSAQCKTQTSNGEVQSPSAQPTARPEAEPSPDKALLMLDCTAGDGGADEHQAPPCTLPTPPPSPLSRGREKRRYRRRSPRSDSSCSSPSSSSSSSSGSRSPKRQKLRHKHSESSSCSSSCSRSVSRSPPRRNRLPFYRSRPSRSRSRSWSRSRSRSPSPRICCRRWRGVYSSRDSRRLRREQEIRIQKLRAIDERRVVYVGRIRRSMTHSELRERFSQFGEVECVSLHFRDRGDHYAFVTFYNMEDAFAAIDNGSKLRRPDELPFDICFGGRRQFCNSNYSDLDADRDTELSPAKSRLEDLDFDSLLQQAQRGQKR